ncbi:MAG: DinB family protein [Bryobacteraceae bacterium]|nr:DinB family protein [Bryobacteraceae bacterium]
MKLVLSFAMATVAFAQAQGPVTLQSMAKRQFDVTHDFVTKSAQKAPEDLYGFQPSKDVRTFGQILGHIAETNYFFCGRLKGDSSNPGKDLEKTLKTKAELVKALQDVRAYCAPVFDTLDEKKTVNNGQRDVPAIGMVYNMNGHTWEHYGNLTTYMRMKGVVPPSSEPRN